MPPPRPRVCRNKHTGAEETRAVGQGLNDAVGVDQFCSGRGMSCKASVSYSETFDVLNDPIVKATWQAYKNVDA